MMAIFWFSLNLNNINLNDFFAAQRRRVHLQHVVTATQCSHNPLLPLIADNSWKKDCFRGKYKVMKISTSTCLKVRRRWFRMRIRNYLRSSQSLAAKRRRSGMISVSMRCWESSPIWRISTARTNDFSLLSAASSNTPFELFKRANFFILYSKSYRNHSNGRRSFGLRCPDYARNY